MRILCILTVSTVLLVLRPRGAAAEPAWASEQQHENEAPCGEQSVHSAHSVVLSVSLLPRVDGWDSAFGHRSGWGLAGGIEFSPWPSWTDVYVEVTFLTNREQRLISADLGLKIPFHVGGQWEVHGVVGPALAYEHFRENRSTGVVAESSFVVGVVAGLGATYWMHRHVGVTLDVNYRVLGGEGIAHRLFSALGIASRW